MNTMKAVVFHGVNDLRVESVPRPQPKAGEAVIRITATTICGTDVHIVKGEYPVRPGLILGHEPVGVIDELGDGLEERIRRRPARDRRRDHAVRPVLLLPERRALAVSRPARRLAVRQHDQRRLGGVPARARRPREPGAGSGRPHRRAGADAAGHRLDRHFRRRERQHQDRRQRGGVRAGPDRAVRDARRKTARRRR